MIPFRTLVTLCLLVVPALAQHDPVQKWNEDILKATHHVLGFTFEERTRWEEKTGVNFGRAVDQQDMVGRLRFGAWVRPSPWFAFSIMGQDARVPFYGAPAPNTLRDTADLQEAYFELGRRTGFAAILGRQMLDYGESRILGTGQWSNVAKTYDTARFLFRTKKATLEALLVSPVRIRPNDFNTPEFGERIWGTYNVFSSIGHGVSLDLYALRHSQNRIGGWSGAGTLGTNSFGGRWYGAARYGFSYSFEGVVQTGHLGLLTQRAFAWYAGVGHPVTVAGLKLNLSANYTEASGTKRGAVNSHTFDQLSPANHDKYGHQDLFGWRNIRQFRTTETLSLTKSLALNVMYSSHWLYSSADRLYNGRGDAIALGAVNTNATHVGQEIDAFVSWKTGPHLFGAGYGHYFRGAFLQAANPHVNPRYLYVFQQYFLTKPH